jgi:PAS domain S-box-containing protein
MILLDIKTLMIVYALLNMISAGAVASVWLQNRRRFQGMSFWFIDMIFQAAGSILIILRGLVPDLVSMTLSNTMVIAGAILILIGLQRFVNIKQTQIHNYILLAIFIVLSAYFTVIQPDLFIREIAFSTMVMIVTFQCAWLLIHRIIPNMRQITVYTGIVFYCYAVFSLMRIILYAFFPLKGNDFFTSGMVDAAAISIYIVLTVGLAISLVLMVNRRLLAEVRLDEEKYTKAFQSSPYAIILTRLNDGKIFEVNNGFTGIFGYILDEVFGKTTSDLQMWAAAKDREETVNKILKGEKVVDAEFQFRKKSGELFTGLFSAESIVINNEMCVLASINDITEQKQIMEVQQRIDKLESLGILAGGIAHDFNNILTSILGNISLAKLETQEGTVVRKLLESTEKSSFRAYRLTQQLITFASGGTPVKNMTDIKELIEDTADIVLKEKGIECVLDIAGDLKNAEVDPGQVSQALTDLLINARQAMPSGGKVEIKAQNINLIDDGSLSKTAVLPEGDYIQIKISDQGVGIPPQYLDKIFDPYFTTKPDGSGLGLAAVHSIISKHKGLVTVESEQGRGSIFTVYLPIGTDIK